MRRANSEFENYPLARKYKWKAERRVIGGMLYVYPPLKFHARSENLSSADVEGFTANASRFAHEAYRLPYQISRQTAGQVDASILTTLPGMKMESMIAVARRMGYTVTDLGTERPKTVKVENLPVMTTRKFRQWLRCRIKEERKRKLHAIHISEYPTNSQSQ